MSKSRAGDIKAIPGHKNYYRSPVSQIIYFKDATTPKFSTGTTKITEAKKEVEKRKLGIAGKSRPVAERIILGIHNPLISSFWFELMDQKKLENEHSTMIKYDVSWRHSIEPFWGDKTVADATDSNIEKYKNWYLENRGDKGAEKAVVHIGMLFRWMFKKKYLRQLPDLGILSNLDSIIAKNTMRKKPGRVYDEQTEILPMLAAAKKISDSEAVCARTYLAILMGVRCGMRKHSEILGIEWSNVNFESRTLKVWSRKNHVWRDVPLVQQVTEALLWQKRFTGKTRWVFPAPTNPTVHISSQVFDRSWVEVKIAAGIRGATVRMAARFHDLRHTFASKTANDGWPPKVACDVLDMSLIEYDTTYAKSSSTKRTEWMEKSFGTTKNTEEKP